MDHDLLILTSERLATVEKGQEDALIAWEEADQEKNKLLKDNKILEKTRENQNEKLTQVEAKLNGLKTKISTHNSIGQELKIKLEETRNESILIDDQGFKKAQEQICFLYLNFNLGELGFYKTVVNSQLVDEVNLEDEWDKDTSLPLLNQDIPIEIPNMVVETNPDI